MGNKSGAVSGNLTSRHVDMSGRLMQHQTVISAGPTLADLAAASGLQPRTIRSWVTRGVLPGPLTRGPAARYPAEAIERLLAIRAMRDLVGMPLAAIRQELLVAAPAQVAEWAAKAAGLAPETREPPTQMSAPRAPQPEAALEYLRGLRARATAPLPSVSACTQTPSTTTPSLRGFDALEDRLTAGRPFRASRKARAEEWLRFPISPDVELHVRGRLDAEARARLERCADLVRDILLGRDQ
jgi:DNA-binding transcriptional MerR regulator